METPWFSDFFILLLKWTSSGFSSSTFDHDLCGLSYCRLLTSVAYIFVTGGVRYLRVRSRTSVHLRNFRSKILRNLSTFHCRIFPGGVFLSIFPLREESISIQFCNYLTVVSVFHLALMFCFRPIEHSGLQLPSWRTVNFTTCEVRIYNFPKKTDVLSVS